MPRPDDIARLVAGQQDIGWLIDRYHDWRSVAADHTPGIRSGLGADGPRGTGTSDPTGETAVAGIDRPDPVVRADRHLRDTIVRAMQDLAKARHDIEKLLNPAAHVRKPGETRTCKTLLCDTVIETSLSAYALKPYCAPCARYMAEHDTRHVPHHVITDRQSKRETRADAVGQ